jgi:uncharacterized membrane protein
MFIKTQPGHCNGSLQGKQKLSAADRNWKKSAASHILADVKNAWQAQIKTPVETGLQRLAMIVYGLQAASLLTGSLTLFAGVIINYVRMEDVQGSWIESHFRWQTKTFWYTLLWLVIGSVTTLILIGWAILLAASLWLIYRIVKGWVYLNEQRAMPY